MSLAARQNLRPLTFTLLCSFALNSICAFASPSDPRDKAAPKPVPPSRVEPDAFTTAPLEVVGSMGESYADIDLSSSTASSNLLTPVETPVPVQNLNAAQLRRLQRKDYTWALDQGTENQISDLLSQLIHLNNNLKERHSAETYQDLLSKRNITVSTSFGSAAITPLHGHSLESSLVVVSLQRSQGEPVDVTFVDFQKVSPEDTQLQIFIADRLQYEPVDVAKTAFGKSVLLVDAKGLDLEQAQNALRKDDNNLFFPKGYNLKAFLRASFFKPSFKTFKTSIVPSMIQLGSAFALCTFANYTGVSDLPAYIPMTLNLAYSSTIGFFLDTYSVFNGKGGALKRFIFNFTSTSLSFAIFLNLWDKGADHLLRPEVLAWIVLNGVANNMIRAALDNNAILDEETKFRTRDEARAFRQRLYSYAAQPLRLGDLAVQSLAQASSTASLFAKSSVKVLFLGIAATAQWSLTRRAEKLAQRAKTDPEFARKIDIAVIQQKAAQFRKNIEEFKAKLRSIPATVLNFVSPPLHPPLNHKLVDRLFKDWNASKTAYFYRLTSSSPIPESEVDIYRSDLVNIFVDFGMASMPTQTKGVHPLSLAEHHQFYSPYSDFSNMVEQRVEYALARFYESGSANNESNKKSAIEYAKFLKAVMFSLREKLTNPKLIARNNLFIDDNNHLIGAAFHLLRDFTTDAPNFGRHFVDNKLADIFGVTASKSVEHFDSRLTMWRYLYTSPFSGKLISQIPTASQTEFLKLTNASEMLKLVEWAEAQKQLLAGPESPVKSLRKTFLIKELEEFTSLARELHRRIDILVKDTRTADGRRQEFTAQDLKSTQDELLAFHALVDYRDNLPERWKLVNTDADVKNYWSYSQSRAARTPAGKVLVPQTCQKLVKLANVIMYGERGRHVAGR